MKSSKMKRLTRTGQQVMVCLIVLFTLTACPKFKSVKYANSVYQGDTLQVDIEMGLNGYTDSAGFEIILTMPIGWVLMDTVLRLEGMNPEKISLGGPERYNDHLVTYSTFVRDYKFSSGDKETITTQLSIINKSDTSSFGNITISVWDGWDNFFGERFTFQVRSENNELAPSQLTFDNDKLRWKAPKNSTELTSYRIYANGQQTNQQFANESLEFNLLPGLNTYRISAVHEGQEVFAQDTLLVNGSRELWVSPDGNDQNNGTKNQPLQTIEHALKHIYYDLTSEKEHFIRLKEGRFPVENLIWKHNVKLVGSGLYETIIYPDNYKEEGISLGEMNGSFHIANLTFENTSNPGLGVNFLTSPELIQLTNVRITNTDNASNGAYLKAKKIILDHVIVDRMAETALTLYADSIYIDHSNFIDNGVGFYTANSHVQISNSIFSKNKVAIDTTVNNGIPGYRTTIDISHSIVPQEWQMNIESNITEAPIFEQEGHYEYLLADDSPGVDQANSEGSDLEDPMKSGMALWPAKGSTKPDMGYYGGILENRFILSQPTLVEGPTFSIFPNPVVHTLNFEGISSSKKYEVILYDQQGRKRLQRALNPSIQQGSLDVSELSKGLYYGKIIHETESHTFKIFKN